MLQFSFIILKNKMASCISDEIEEAIERVFKQRVSLRERFVAIYNGKRDTEYHLRYILRCIGLNISGTKAELVSRIEENGIKIDDAVYDQSAFVENIAKYGVDFCPIYFLKVYLKKHGLSDTGHKYELVARTKQHLGNLAAITILSFNTEDKKFIAEAIHAVDHGNIPSEHSIHIMEQHGYRYDKHNKHDANASCLLCFRCYAPKRHYVVKSPSANGFAVLRLQ
jgi:hypothetical protein